MINYKKYFYLTRLYFFIVLNWIKNKIIPILMLILFISNIIFYNKIQSILFVYFSNLAHFNILQSLLISLCGAMLTVTAIAASFIVFAMQTNIERMPYGLFKKFSSDIRLLIYFFVTFILAIIVGILPIVFSHSMTGYIILGSFWSLILIITCLLLAYKRALKLICPTEQLMILAADTKKKLNAWAKAAEKYKVLLTQYEQKTKIKNGTTESNHDLVQLFYFQQFPQWTSDTKQAIRYAFSLAKYHAMQGDYESVQAALNSITFINSEYIVAKGKTFFSDNPLFFNTSLSTDTIINDTLENLRKYVQIGLSRGDEQQIILAFNALKDLCMTYLTIDYANNYPAATHVNLAVAYLTNAIESVIPHKMTDVIMEGTRLLGHISLSIMEHGNVDDIATISEKISIFSVANVIEQKTRPITFTGVEQLAKMTMFLLKSKNEYIEYALNKIRSDVTFIVKIVLELQDTPLLNIHQYTLSYYYSVISYDTLSHWLTVLANTLLKADATDENGQRIVRHIAQWGDGLYKTQKELLLLAINKNSSFTFDVVYWVIQITTIFLDVATAPCCPEYCHEKLIKHARWLINIFSWIPDNKETISLIGNYQLADQLFKVASEAHRYACWKIESDISAMLISLALKGGKYQVGRNLAEQSYYALACLHIISELDDSVLFNQFSKGVQQYGAPNSDIKADILKSLQNDANNYYQSQYNFSQLDRIMNEIDKVKLKNLLVELLDIKQE